MAARLLRHTIIIGFILTTSSAFAQHTYHISKEPGERCEHVYSMARVTLK